MYNEEETDWVGSVPCTNSAWARNHPAIIRASCPMLCGVGPQLLQEPDGAEFTDDDLSGAEVDLAGDHDCGSTLPCRHWLHTAAGPSAPWCYLCLASSALQLYSSTVVLLDSPLITAAVSFLQRRLMPRSGCRMPRTWWMAAMCCRSQNSCHCPDRATFIDQVVHTWQTCWRALTPLPSTILVSPPNM